MRSLFCLFSFSCAQEQQHAEQQRCAGQPGDVHILHEACERVGTLDELMDAMNPKDGYEMRLFIQTPGRQFAFYRIPERLSNLEDYANEGCSVRGTKDEIMAEIFTEWAPAQEDLEDDFEL